MPQGLIPTFFIKLFGDSWQSTLWGWLTIVFVFIYTEKELFENYPLLVAVSKYIALGTGAKFVHKVADSKSKSVSP